MKVVAHAPLSNAWLNVDGIQRFLRLSIMDFRHGFGVWIVLALVAAGCWFYVLSPSSGPGVILWGYQSVQLSWMFAVIGPIGGGWGAWLAGRSRRTRTEAMMASTPISGIVQDARTLLVPVAGALGAYLVIALIVIGQTAMEATWGGPVWTVILYGAALTVGYTIIGTVAGMLFPARLIPLIAGAGLFLFTVVTYSTLDYNSAYRYFAPYQWVANPNGYDALLYRPFNHVPVPFWAAFGMALGATTVSLAVLAWARYGRRSGVVLGIVAAAILVPSLNAAVVRDEAMPGYAAPVINVVEFIPPSAIENPPLVCAGEIIETCVHQAFERQLDNAASHADAIVAPIAGLTGVPGRMEQRADVLSTDEVVRFTDTWEWGSPEEAMDRVVVNALFPSPVLFDAFGYDSEYDRTAAQAAIGRWLVIQAGGRGYFSHEFVGVEFPTGTLDNPPSEAAWQAYMQETERIQSEVNAAAQRFAMLPAEEQDAWLEANWDALRSGELTLEDLP